MKRDKQKYKTKVNVEASFPLPQRRKHVFLFISLVSNL